MTDSDTLYANLLSGRVDVFHENTLAPNQGFDLKRVWEQTGDGTVGALKRLKAMEDYRGGRLKKRRQGPWRRKSQPGAPRCDA